MRDKRSIHKYAEKIVVVQNIQVAKQASRTVIIYDFKDPGITRFRLFYAFGEKFPNIVVANITYLTNSCQFEAFSPRGNYSDKNGHSCNTSCCILTFQPGVLISTPFTPAKSTCLSFESH